MRTKWCGFIARGGMATVYEAFQPALQALGRAQAARPARQRPEPCPALHPRVAPRRRRSTTRTSSPSSTSSSTTACPYIAMEYLAARVAAAVRRASCRTRRCSASCSGMLAGLAHAEEHGVAHRDLKPENLLITAHAARSRSPTSGSPRPTTSTTAQLTATGVARGDADLHGPRAGDGAAGRPVHRPVRGRRDRLRDAERRPAVRGRRLADGAAVQARQRAAAAAGTGRGSADRRLGRRGCSRRSPTHGRPTRRRRGASSSPRSSTCSARSGATTRRSARYRATNT